MKLECRENEMANFSIQYAQPCGGKRTFRFRDAADLAEHVSQNRPAFFQGVPYLGEKYNEKLDQMRQRGYRLPSDE